MTRGLSGLTWCDVMWRRFFETERQRKRRRARERREYLFRVRHYYTPPHSDSTVTESQQTASV